MICHFLPAAFLKPPRLGVTWTLFGDRCPQRGRLLDEVFCSLMSLDLGRLARESAIEPIDQKDHVKYVGWNRRNAKGPCQPLRVQNDVTSQNQPFSSHVLCFTAFRFEDWFNLR